jgi:glycosyltransferase involved in cell wall biosynthesis
VLVTNRSQREMLLASVPKAPDDVVLVRNGPLRASIPDELPIRPGSLRDPHLVYVGVLGRQDGVDRLPDLLGRLVHDHGLEGARLTVVGFGSEEAALARALRERGLAEHAVLTGRVPHDEAMRIMASADICLDTAVGTPFNHRSTMVKVIEYLALARPTVAFALHETVNTAGDAARFAPCGDWDAFARLVAELACDESLRREMRRRALARREMLVWERSEAELLGAYRRMLARRPQRRPVSCRRGPAARSAETGSTRSSPA